MNILILANGDWSGAGNALYQAINEYTTHKTRQVAYHQSYLDYPCDVFNPTVAELRKLWEWSDVVNIHDGAQYRKPPGTSERPIIKTYHGSEYRARWVYFNQTDRDAGYPSTALNLDLAMLGPKWIGRAVPDLTPILLREMAHHPMGGRPFRVAYAPKKQTAQDTQKIIEAIDALDGVELVMIEGVPNAECLRIKAGCDLLIDEFQLGYGTNALENWAMGIPVIAHAHPNILQVMKMRLGELPFVDTPIEHLRAAVEALANDCDLYKEAKDRGRAYWQMYHHPAVVATQFTDLCEELIQCND